MIVVACAADEKFTPHCAAMLHSAWSHNQQQGLKVFFLHDPAYSREVLDQFLSWARALPGLEIEALPINPDTFAGLTVHDIFPTAAWYRIALAEMLPQLDRILYLDADTLVLGSLEPLWNTPLDGHCLGAITQPFPPWLFGRHLEIGLRNERDYFNSGVLLMNLAEMRRQNALPRFIHVALNEQPGAKWPDQDALNAVLAGKWTRLEPRWNVLNVTFANSYCVPEHLYGETAWKQAVFTPGIVHFEGGNGSKPWQFGCRHPYRQHYLDHRRATPWPRVRMENFTLHNWARTRAPEFVFTGVRWVRQKLIDYGLARAKSNPWSMNE